jgi:hypothetical protein
MEQKHAMRELISFNKSVLDQAFNVMALLQEQTERLITISLEAAQVLPQEGRKDLSEWLKVGKKGGEIFRKTVDDGFQKLESFWA